MAEKTMGKMAKIKTLRISEELHDFLNKMGNRGESFEQVIWRLIKEKEKKK